MNRFKLTLAVSALAAATMATAQTEPVLYAPGRLIKDQGITLKAWGSGTAVESDETGYEGTNSIRISSRNYFQGGIVNLGQPKDLANSYSDPDNLLRVMLFVPTSNTTFGGGGRVGGPPGGVGGNRGVGGGRGATGGGNRNVGGARGGGIGTMGGPPGGMMPGMGMGRTQRSAETDLKSIRLLITTTDGKRSEAYVPVNPSGTSENNWLAVGVPLKAISGFDRTNKVIKSIALAGDAPTTFFVGDIRVLSDSTPISGDPNVRDMNLALGDEVQLYGVGYAGATPLVYTWDFNDKDGIQEDAVGQVIKHKFRTPGKSVITLTIKDKFGLKKPYSTTINVTVNP